MFFRAVTPATIFLCIVVLGIPASVAGQEPFVPQGILMGEGWNPQSRELDTVYADQDTLDLGTGGVRSVQFWADVRNAAGRTLTWVVEYDNGVRNEVFDQKIRYDRFRTYMEKTFRRTLWAPEQREQVDVTGSCTVKLVDRQNNEPVAVKIFTIR